MTWTTLPRSEAAGGLAVHRAGDGPPLLLVHGVGLRADCWSGVMPALTTRFTVSAIDLPGHGDSARLGAEHPTLADYVDAVEAALPDAPVVVVGHSLGALVALELAVREPERVAGVAAVNAVYRRDERASAAVRARAASLDGATPADPSGTLQRWFGDPPMDGAADAATACERWLRDVDPAGYRDAYRAFATGDAPSDAALNELRCPALFITGEHEPNSTPAMSRALSERVPDGRCRIVAGARHLLPMTHVAELGDALVDRFDRAELDRVAR